MSDSIYARAMTQADESVKSVDKDEATQDLTPRELIENCVKNIKDKDLTPDALNDLIIKFVELVKE